MKKLAVYSVQAAAACAASMFAVPAVLAQDAPSAKAGGLEEITVTARRREESLQDVPIALSAFSAERITNAGAPDITWLQQSTPNLTLQVARGTNSTLIAFIRGIGQQDPLWGFEPGRRSLRRRRVRGPPAGRGARHLRHPAPRSAARPARHAVRPQHDRRRDQVRDQPLGNEARLDTKLTLGTYAQHDFIASGVLPLSDTFSVGGSAAIYRRDGYGENQFTGNEKSLREERRRVPHERRVEPRPAP